HVAVNEDTRVNDGKAPMLQVNVRPAQTRHLAAPQPALEEEKPCCVQTIFGDMVEEPGGLVRIPVMHLMPLSRGAFESDERVTRDEPMHRRVLERHAQHHDGVLDATRAQAIATPPAVCL